MTTGRNNYWAERREDARKQVAVAIIQTMDSYRRIGRCWLAVGELADDLRQQSCCSMLRDIPRRMVGDVVRGALEMLYRAGTVDRCLGDDLGREVRVYGLKPVEAQP